MEYGTSRIKEQRCCHGFGENLKRQNLLIIATILYGQ